MPDAVPTPAADTRLVGDPETGLVAHPHPYDWTHITVEIARLAGCSWPAAEDMMDGHSQAEAMTLMERLARDDPDWTPN